MLKGRVLRGDHRDDRLLSGLQTCAAARRASGRRRRARSSPSIILDLRDELRVVADPVSGRVPQWNEATRSSKASTLRYGDKVVLQNLLARYRRGRDHVHHRALGCGQVDDPALDQRSAKPDAGKVIRARARHLLAMRERDLIEVRETIGFSFQFAALFDSL
jgi:hypothetical protein